ncbi:MAG: 2-isopropylmalate synthase [Candidatus Bathyarchaeota archaeon]|nr:2-isopropylmalate synthase [Candidatus Bathyarchaeota archaeon]MDW8022969.1 2-isopropylmalate synthase [Nitrososphaerota archaeon]
MWTRFRKWGIALSLSNFAEKIRFFDTTLRDGEQTPGVSLTPKDKLEIARKLDELGVDAIEAGFAASTEGEFEAIKLIAGERLKAEIFSFARANKKDIDAVVGSDADGVFLVIPSSEIHIKHKLGKKYEDILKLAEECIQYAKDHGLKVEFGAEDATRSEEQFLKKLIAVSVDAGADIVTPCDTVGVLTPEKAHAFYSDLVKSFPNVAFSVHCHDDFGMAVANSVAALRAGAIEVHTTVNGVGERAGNAALEEVAVTLELLYGVKVPIKMKLLYEASVLVSKLTGVPVQPNKAIVGENAFAHESGIHTHAILSNPLTYEPIPPDLVGRTRRLVVGKHAGSRGIKAVLNEMGIFPNEEQLKEIFAKVKMLGDKGKRVTDSDLVSIAGATMNLPLQRPLELQELTVVTGNKVTPTASVKLKVKGKVIVAAATGVGPVDAAINAIRRAVQTIEPIKLDGYYVKSISGGTDAIVEVVVHLSKGDMTTTAWGAREDIVMASVEAMLSGINNIISRGNAADPQREESLNKSV